MWYAARSFTFFLHNLTFEIPGAFLYLYITDLASLVNTLLSWNSTFVVEGGGNPQFDKLHPPLPYTVPYK